MQTSIRYGGDSKAIRFHAKQNISLNYSTFLQARGELDTKSGVPGQLNAMIRHFYSDISASLGVGVQYNKREKLRFVFRGKKAFPVTNDGLVSFNIKGRCDVDKEFKEKKSTGAVEFSWGILNFQKNQDIRLKVGCEVFDQLPYMQIRENNWTLNINSNGRWSVRYHL